MDLSLNYTCKDLSCIDHTKLIFGLKFQLFHSFHWKSASFFFSGDEMYLISPMLAVDPLTPRSD